MRLAPVVALAFGVSTGWLTACLRDGTDSTGRPPVPRTEPLGHASNAAHVTNPGVTGYWRRPLDPDPNEAELWLYRNDPEIGFNVHVPSDARLVSRSATGSSLIRQAFYWERPIEQSLAQLNDLVTAAPDGATLVLAIHSKDVCVDYGTPGDREAKYRAFAGYVRTLAEAAPRSGRVRAPYWQIYNEMNLTGWTNMFGGPMMLGTSITCPGDGASAFLQGQRYAELLRLVYPAIKEATNDSGWVIMGGLASNDSSTDVYSTTGRYGFLHGMYAGGARDYYDIAAIQPYGHPGRLAIRRTADFDRALAVYGDETRPMFMTEFGSKEPEPRQWPDLQEQIESARSTRMYGKAFIFVICGGEDPYALLINACQTPRPAFSGIQAAQYNSLLYGRDSVERTDVVVRRRRGDLTPIGYAVVDEGPQFRILDVPVRHDVPTRVRFQSTATAGVARVEVQVRAFIDQFGWTEWGTDSAVVGAKDFLHPINAIQLRTVNATDTRVRYAVFQGGMWGEWVAHGAIAGDTTKSVAAFRVVLETNQGDPSPVGVCYGVHRPGLGWSAAQCDAAPTPLTSLSTPLTALRLWAAHP